MTWGREGVTSPRALGGVYSPGTRCDWQWCMRTRHHGDLPLLGLTVVGLCTHLFRIPSVPGGRLQAAVLPPPWHQAQVVAWVHVASINSR